MRPPSYRKTGSTTLRAAVQQKPLRCEKGVGSATGAPRVAASGLKPCVLAGGCVADAAVSVARLLQLTGQGGFIAMREPGLEPGCREAADPKSAASTSSATPAGAH